MVEDVALRDAEVVRERSGKVLEVPAHLVDKFESDLRIGRAAAGVELVTSVGQTEPRCIRESVRQRAAHEGSTLAIRGAPCVGLVR